MPKRTGSRAIAHYLCQMFPGMVFIGRGTICKPSPIHFIEGAVAESTPYKGTFYIWSMMSPMWATVQQPTLDYGKRVGPDPTMINGCYFDGPEERIAEQAAAIFRANDVFARRLTAPEMTLETFLADYVPDNPRTRASWIRIEHRALALALTGQTEEALAIFRTALKDFNPSSHNHYGLTLCAVRDSLAANDGRHVALITEMEVAAAKQVGLVRPVAEGD
jgi:hypothetical protein